MRPEVNFRWQVYNDGIDGMSNYWISANDLLRLFTQGATNGKLLFDKRSDQNYKYYSTWSGYKSDQQSGLLGPVELSFVFQVRSRAFYDLKS